MIKPPANGIPIGAKELSQAFEATIFHLFERNSCSRFQVCIQELIETQKLSNEILDEKPPTHKKYVSCGLCGMSIRKERLPLHLTSRCNKRRIVCSHCSTEVSYEDQSSHMCYSPQAAGFLERSLPQSSKQSSKQVKDNESFLFTTTVIQRQSVENRRYEPPLQYFCHLCGEFVNHDGSYTHDECMGFSSD